VDDKPEISIVVPVYNGAGALPQVYAGIAEAMASLERSFEVLFVDDGSTDDSWRLIAGLRQAQGDRIRGFRLARNAGQQAATSCGLLEARGTWVVTLDDDLQPHPREIAALWARAQAGDADVVYGVYATLRHGRVHRVGTRLFRMLLRRVSPSFPDGSSFRLIRSTVLASLPRRPGPGVFVDPMLAWQTAAVTSVVVDHGRPEARRSTYSLPMLVAIAWALLITYSTVPLRLMTGIGFLSATVSFGLGLYYLVKKVKVGAQVGFSATIVTTTFASGLILFSLGILGENLSRIHSMGTGEPAFTVRTVL
jgi:glycosyltransferase involved in cell wall biosynthesis